VIRTTRISHSVFETPDLHRQVEYYTDVLGLTLLARSPKEAFLGGPSGQEVIGFVSGSTNRCLQVAFQVAPDCDAKTIASELGKAGISCEQRSDVSPYVTSSTAFVDPKGTQIQLYSAHKEISIPRSGAGIGIMKLGHIAFSVPSAAAITDFYVNTLGFRVSDWIEDIFAFLRCGPDHHSVNFLSGKQTFMHHIAYELRDWGHMLTACEILGREKRPIIWGPGRHRVGHNIFAFHRDPDDNIIELYTQLDQMKEEDIGAWEARPWHPMNPLKPRVWTRAEAAPCWGMGPSDDFRRNGNQHLNG
jgi:catechol 2,3-dioxygenase-like lactoylglutathione lyase family enzyme